MRIIIAMAIVIAVVSVGLAAAGVLAVAIMHAREDMSNWERWNDNDDRRNTQGGKSEEEREAQAGKEKF